MPWKQYQPLERYDAADLQAHGMNQAVLQFESEAQRAEQLTTPVTGMVSVIDDYAERYDGTMWQPHGTQVVAYGSRAAVNVTIGSQGEYREATLQDNVYARDGWTFTNTTQSVRVKFEGIYLATFSVAAAVGGDMWLRFANHGTGGSGVGVGHSRHPAVGGTAAGALVVPLRMTTGVDYAWQYRIEDGAGTVEMTDFAFTLQVLRRLG